MCIDYRKLNKATKKDHFPLPFIYEMLEQLAKHSYFYFLDGYRKALHLISSSESNSNWRLPSACAVSYISRWGDFHMMSADSIALEPYTRKKESDQ